MLGSRKDIIGDLYRLRMELASSGASDVEELQGRLEVLAAVAVAFGMSHTIVIKASNVARQRIDELLTAHSDRLQDLGRSEGYQRHRSGVVARR